MSVSIFFCYAHEDEALLNKLKTQLRSLQRQGLIDVWHDRDINAGTEWEKEIKKHLKKANIILLLVSPDFINSDYCYSIEMKRALVRHQRGEAQVIPIILRFVHWQGILGNLQALPTDAKPVNSWSDIDEAFFDITEGIRKVVVQLGSKALSPSEVLLSQASKRESEAGFLTVQTPQSAKPTSSIKQVAVSWLRAFAGHTGGVTSVAISPDGQTLASGSRDQTIKLWDLATGKELHTLTGDTWHVSSVAFSPDGQTLVSGDDYTIKLWNVTTGKELSTLGGTKSVNSVAFSPDGLTLASSGRGKTIRLWDLATEQELRTFKGHTFWVNSVVYSPDGQTLASGSDDTTINIWGKK